MKIKKSFVFSLFSLLILTSIFSLSATFTAANGNGETIPECSSDNDCIELPDDPSTSCYVGECNEGYCEYPFTDDEGPVTSDLTVTKVTNVCAFDIEALATDECSVIEEAEYFLQSSCPDKETRGTPLDTDEDGNFLDELVEEVLKNNVGGQDGEIPVIVRAKDAEGNWGDCELVQISLDCIPPKYPTCEIGNTNPNAEFPNGIVLKEMCNHPTEKLVCGTNPLLEANICDTESGIQLAEYFLDDEPLINFQGTEMEAFDGSYDEQCEDVEALIDLDPLVEGTHFVQLHGKDTQETWGKFNNNPVISFIKDTTPPKTEKEIEYAGEGDINHIRCDPEDFNYPEHVDAEDVQNGCDYVLPGTEIWLSADDFNPDNPTNDGYNDLPGEYDGDVIIRANIWFNEDCTANGQWKLQEELTSGVDQDLHITLNDDSCHLIEYWAEDGFCGNEEEHHFELDIVDSTPPKTEKTIDGNKIPGNENPIDFYINSDTEITLDCGDLDPHPVGGEVLHWELFYGGANVECEDVDWNQVKKNEPLRHGWEEEGQVTISDLRESCHRLEWSCEDALGNPEESRFEIDAVDNTPPTITKGIIGPYHGDCLPESEEDTCFIDGVTEIQVDVTDPLPHPVDQVTCDWDYDVIGGDKEGQGETGITTFPFRINFPEESQHVLTINCTDALGNFAEDVETFFVDKTPPKTVKIYGQPFFSAGLEDYSTITNAANRIVDLQDDDGLPSVGGSPSGAIDGSWDWIVTNQAGPTGTTFRNIAGVTGEVLLDAYDLAGNDTYFIAAKNTGDYILSFPISTSNRYNAFNINYLYHLYDATGDASYKNHADALMNHILNEENHWSLNSGDHCTSSGCTAQQLYDALFEFRGSANGKGIVRWDMYNFVEAAQRYGENSWANDLKIILEDSYSTLASNDKTYIIGLSAIVLATENANAIQDLLDAQNLDGSWDDENGVIQDTAYALMALEKVGEVSVAKDAAVGYLADNFGYPGGFEGWLESDGNEYSEVTSEAAQALYDVVKGSSEWITTDTNIILLAGDPEPHRSGVRELNYRIKQLDVEDEEACRSMSLCQSLDVDEWDVEGQGSPLFKSAVARFNIDKESCHLIEFWSVDNVDKTEKFNRQCVFVDDTPPITDKAVGEPKILCEDGEEKCGPESQPNGIWESWYVNSSTPITLSCEDQPPHPVDHNELCFAVSWHGTEYNPAEFDYITPDYEEVYDGHWQTVDNVRYRCVELDQNQEFKFNFQEDSLHNLEWFCQDALGNREEEVNVEWDNVDNKPPFIAFVNPTVDFANNVEMCIQSVVVMITDEKSGVDEESIHATLVNSEEEVVRDVELEKEIVGNTVTYQALMDKEVSDGEYELIVHASDNLGNEASISRTEIIKEGVFAFIANNTCSDLNVDEGGECWIDFNVCMRGGNGIKFWMDKSFDGAVSPELLDTIIKNSQEDMAPVGLKELLAGVDQEECEENAEAFPDEYEWINGEPGECWFTSDTGMLPLACEEIHGLTEFSLHFNLDSEVTSALGTGVHETDYWIDSFFDVEFPLCNPNDGGNGHLVINEFVANPSEGDDWVEVYNNGDESVNLNECYLKDGSSGGNQLDLSGTLNSVEFAAFDWDSRLNQNDDTISLYCNDILIDQVTYGSGGDVAAPGEGQSAGRSPDGSDNLVVFDTITKGISNA